MIVVSDDEIGNVIFDENVTTIRGHASRTSVSGVWVYVCTMSPKGDRKPTPTDITTPLNVLTRLRGRDHVGCVHLQYLSVERFFVAIG